jgi:hypothetical protein
MFTTQRAFLSSASGGTVAECETLLEALRKGTRKLLLSVSRDGG